MKKIILLSSVFCLLTSYSANAQISVEISDYPHGAYNDRSERNYQYWHERERAEQEARDRELARQEALERAKHDNGHHYGKDKHPPKHHDDHDDHR